MNEFELIQHYFKRTNAASGASSHVIEGIGDDCAVVSIPKGCQLALSIDTLVEGVHFLKDAPPFDIGQRAFRVSVSDLAAMGASPLWFTLALTLPPALLANSPAWLEQFSKGLFVAADAFGCRLIGGDTTKGEVLTISVQVHGTIPENCYLGRGHAQAGDMIAVTGPLGDGAGALAHLQGRIQASSAAAEHFYRQFYQPEPKIKAGRLLLQLANAAIDVSDGLLADLNHLCDASRLAAQVNVDGLPYSPALLEVADTAQRQSWALTGGDDYQLCFTVAEKHWSELSARFKAEHLPLHAIGQMTSGQGISVTGNLQCDISQYGYRHF